MHTQHPGPAGDTAGLGRLSETKLGMEHTPAPGLSTKMVVMYLGVQILISSQAATLLRGPSGLPRVPPPPAILRCGAQILTAVCLAINTYK